MGRDESSGSDDATAQAVVSQRIGNMRSDLIDLSHQLRKGDPDLPRLWNAAYDALVALQKCVEGRRS